MSHATWLKIAFSGLETRLLVLESSSNILKAKGKSMKCMADSKENKHRDLGSKRIIHEFESPGKFNLSPGKVLKIGFYKMGEFFFRPLKFLMQLF